MGMRIIGGEYKSRLIQMPKGVEIRPTQDRVREAIFNILGDVNDKKVLDIFAGSGAFGLEAISRGAAYVSFIDVSSKCTGTIRQNLDSLAIEDYQYDIYRGNAFAVLPRLEKEGSVFDLVFLDPPYYKEMAKKCLICLDCYDILSPNALIVAEHFRKDSLEAEFEVIGLEKERAYGDTVITIFRKHE
jgi:16S rRNA (guanine(966)-N(2))-methyltransferase RsmD